MPDEININAANVVPEVDGQADGKVETKIDKRIKDALDKKTEAETKATDAENRARIAEEKLKTMEFENKHAELSKKYPKASEFKDKIKELVDKGYDPEDATVSILSKNNALQTAEQTQQAKIERSNFGGSASTPITNADGKSPKDMTSSELRSALIEAERNGEITI